MTQTVMDHLLKGRLELGGETRVVTILFCDIRGFTSISERMGAQSLVKLLNEFFTAMVTILMEEDAVVDKYIGDAIMAVFGAPISKPDDPLRAVRAAVRMRDALTSLNADLATRGIPEMRMGIGIHTGEVVAGNIGSNARMEYTVIGDAVNLASRLESATKDLDASILVSEDTYALVRDQVSAVERGELPIRGRDRPVLAYEVTGLV
jgi:adenylate cyclase